MKRTKRLKPYDSEGRTNFPARNVPGVYMIWRVGLFSEELKYVGFGRRDVYKALYRHFQVWNDKQAQYGKRGDRITYPQAGAYRVRVIYCKTGAQAGELERALILKYKPVDNPDKLELYDITPHGTKLATAPDAAPFVVDMEAPF